MPNIPDHIKALIKNCDPNVTEVDLHDCGLNSNNITELVDLLNNNKFITFLNLHRNNINSDALPELAKLKYVQEIDLSYNNIGDTFIASLARSSIRKLDLSTTRITNVGGLIFAESSNQISIHLYETKVSDEVKKKIKERLENNSSKQLKSILISPQTLNDKLTNGGEINSSNRYSSPPKLSS